MRIRRAFILFVLILVCSLPVSAQCLHDYVERRQEPVCDNPGMVWKECILCGDTKEFDDIPATGHTFGAWSVTQPATCARAGKQSRECVLCGSTEEAVIAPLGHSYECEVVPATCTARGYTSNWCSNCGDRYRTDYVDALGHNYDKGVITKEPTLTAMGRLLYTCIRCGETNVVMMPKLTNPYVDVAQEDYYFTPVLWAVSYGVTTGMDETHFGPAKLCTRAQVAVFLWRLAGKPEPQSSANPFVDVHAGAYYEQAVLWAHEMGITNGMDDTHFGPEERCTRAQVVTFLYRYRGSPEPGLSSIFPDVKKKDYFYNAVLWAARREITVGMDGGKFCPNILCTRGQIVTFLYRDVKNP